MHRTPSFCRLLWILALVVGASACNDNELATGPPPPAPPDWTDMYQQGSVGGEVDILWVVDNSGSMDDEQTKLAERFDQFIRLFVDLQLDFRIAIVTTDMEDASESGRFQGTPTILTPDTPDLINVFKNNIKVGTNGSGQEMGLEAARTALSEPLLSTTNTGFLRDTAHLAVIFVSDEEDGGSETPAPIQDAPADFVRHFHDLTDGDFSLSAIIGDVPTGCTGTGGDAQSGDRYAAAADSVDGLVYSICEEDFGPLLTQLSEFIGSQVTSKFPASYEPDVDTIRVWVDEVEIFSGPNTWSYDHQLAAVVFAAGAEPDECAQVVIAYARVTQEPLVAEPGGTGYDPICWETMPEDVPEPTFGGSLEGGWMTCAVSRSSPRGVGWIACLLVLAALVVRRRKTT